MSISLWFHEVDYWKTIFFILRYAPNDFSPRPKYWPIYYFIKIRNRSYYETNTSPSALFFLSFFLCFPLLSVFTFFVFLGFRSLADRYPLFYSLFFLPSLFDFPSSEAKHAPLLLDSHQRSLFRFIFFLSPLPRTTIPGRVVPVLTTVMGDLHANGIVFGEDRPCGSSPPSPPLPISNPDPSSVAADAWAAAEQTTGEILRSIQPTLAADRRRREVVDYVQRLIRYGARCEVMLLALFDSRQYSIVVVVTDVVLVAWMFALFFFVLDSV